MFCLDCHHQLVSDGEKALSGEIQMVWRSLTTQEWICERTGDEHRAGSAVDYVNHVRKVVPAVLEMVENGDIPGHVGLDVLATDLGFKDRSEGSKQITRLLDAVADGTIPEDVLGPIIDGLPESTLSWADWVERGWEAPDREMDRKYDVGLKGEPYRVDYTVCQHPHQVLIREGYMQCIDCGAVGPDDGS